MDFLSLARLYLHEETAGDGNGQQQQFCFSVCRITVGSVFSLKAEH